MKTVKSLKRAVKAGVEAASKPIPKERKYRVKGKLVKCSHCSGERLAFAPMIVGLALKCAICSHLEIFADVEGVNAVD